ncbi:DEAD/DEAH box helicase family protein [Desulfitobacterium sp.]|nr:DEAD/DEAH box helicase family protein [Desulfitobacterium sp.]MEA4900711.1 helicase C-terminal domain-containing protein [Desulfitobacterium sp.]
MSIDFSKFRKKAEVSKETHPIKIYDSLRGLNDLWRGQYLALEEWYRLREQDNHVISLNTGGGKTIIGLLQAQSIVNETRGRVFYLCGSIQLIKQTEEAAKMIGLSVATYFSRQFSNEAEFNKGNVLCITTYQALFNGRSRFAKDEISGLIFDDSHVASHIIRDHYTLHLEEDTFPITYSTLVDSVKSYFETVHAYQLFDEVIYQKTDSSTLFIPTFLWDQIYKKIIEVLVDEGVSVNANTKYSWEHLRDYLDLCAVFITSKVIEITPFIPPVHLQTFMGKETKKIFLSATIQNEPDFIRSFGFPYGEKIEPETRAGESERLIITPYVNSPLIDNLFKHIEQLSKVNKILVIPNSEKRGRRWRQIESSFSSSDFAIRVEEFKKSHTGLLVAPARFEGMDFPNDTCRILVIDGLPSGTGLLEKFLWNTLGEIKSLQGIIASRVVQSLGRISRGNDDYGIVFLLGNDLADWITRRKNRDRIPRYIEAQLQLGERVTEQLATIEDLEKIESAILTREKEWIDLHQEEVNGQDSFSKVEESNENELMVKVAEAERKFINYLWEREYHKAARVLEQTLGELFKSDKGLAGWHCHWIGYCYLKEGNITVAEQYFNRAGKNSKALGVLPTEIEKAVGTTLILDEETQVGRIMKVLNERGEINYGSFSQMSDRLAALSNAENVSSNSYEEALRWLGAYLGYQSSRPDHESGIGRGPDNFWVSDKNAIMIECKSDKKGKAFYSKKEIGQSYNHIEWIKEEYPEKDLLWKLMIAGPDVIADPPSSPSDQMNIWLPEEIWALAMKIRNLLLDTWKYSTLATYYSNIERNLAEALLTHEDIFNGLPTRPIKK